MHKGGGSQAEILTVAYRNKLDEHPCSKTSRESGLDREEGASAKSWQTYPFDWMVAPLPQEEGEVFDEVFCSSPDPGANWRMLTKHSARRLIGRQEGTHVFPAFAGKHEIIR